MRLKQAEADAASQAISSNHRGLNCLCLLRFREQGTKDMEHGPGERKKSCFENVFNYSARLWVLGKLIQSPVRSRAPKVLHIR